MKYIDTDIIRKEIERLKRNSESAKCEWIKEGYNQNAFAEDCRISSFDKLLSLIDSLQQEQPEEDLERDFSKAWAIHHIPKEFIQDILEKRGFLEFIYNTARQFYELGRNAR